MSFPNPTTLLEWTLPPADQHTPLLRLPFELRQQIYTYILPVPSLVDHNVTTIFRIIEADEKKQRRIRTYERVLGLSRTCQVFYDELLPLYYRQNRFRFESAYDLYRWLYMIGARRRLWIREVEFWLRDRSDWDAMDGKIWWGIKPWQVYEWAIELLRECRELQKLGVGVSMETKTGMKSGGPVKGLEGLKGMGLKRVDVKVRQVFKLGPFEPSLFVDDQEWYMRQYFPKGWPEHFKKEQLLGLQKRLRAYMMTDSEGNMREGTPIVEGNPHGEKPAQGRRKQRARKTPAAPVISESDLVVRRSLRRTSK